MRAKYIVLCAALIGGFVFYSVHHHGAEAVTESDAAASTRSNAPGVDMMASDAPTKQLATASRPTIKNAPHLVDQPTFPRDLAANFEALRSRAEHGDADMAYALANALFVCDTQSSKDVEEKCRNLSQKQIDEFPKLLDIAASHGNVGAQLAYAPMVGRMMAREAGLPDENAIRTFKYKTMSYLNQAASRGSVEALNRLALVYQSGNLAPKDPVTAYAYMYATSKTGLIPTSSDVLSLWSRSLSNSDMTIAVNRGEAIYRSCCVSN